MKFHDSLDENRFLNMHGILPIGMKITISGMPGAGRSKVAVLLAGRLACACFQIGQLRRKMATELGISLQELNELGETQAFTDQDVDQYTAQVAESHDNIVIDGRVAFHFVQNSFKVFLDVALDTGVQRIFNNKENKWNESNYYSFADAKEAISTRIRSDRSRYKKYYGIDYLDRSNYDFVVDTTDKTIPEVVEAIEQQIKAQSL